MPTSAPAVRSTQRTVLTCSACAQRKIRCSKDIPCTACIRQNKADSCRREQVAVVTRGRTARRNRGRPNTSPHTPRNDTSVEIEETQTVSTSSPADVSAAPSLPLAGTAPGVGNGSFDPALTGITNETLMRILTLTPTASSRLTNEAAAALEFLAQGRRNVLNRLSGCQHVTPPSAEISTGNHGTGEQWDSHLPPNDVRMLLALHQAHLAWMHHVVHLPTFLREFEENLLRSQCDKFWLALYYAMLSHTFYHLDDRYLLSLPQPISGGDDASRILFDKSLETLYEAGFMYKHNLIAIQAICILLQVAHNIDKADHMGVLISTAIRISQFLNLHRLGSDQSPGIENISSDEAAMSHLMQKRVWWFLVRYDWLQIPFQNTCQIHPAQFNTAMPTSEIDDAQRTVNGDTTRSWPEAACTSNIWTEFLNRLSVIVWKHQDRMFTVGHPDNNEPDGTLKLYDQVLWADREIKQIYTSLPWHIREIDQPSHERSVLNGFPLELMPGLVHLCTAHKIFSVHRSFQLSCFKDRRFAFSQFACVSIAERSIEAIQQWPDTLESWVCRRMWTTLTHVVSCCITLILALLYKDQNTLTYDIAKLRRYINFGRRFIAREECTSSIARRGGRLIRALMDLEGCSEFSIDLEADIGETVRQVAAADAGNLDTNTTEAHQVMFPFENGFLNSFA